MNYIELINNFWKVDMEHSFTGNETRLYFYLLHTSNSLGWKNPFRLSYRQIGLGSGLSVNTVKSARNKLKQTGLIDFAEGKRGNAKDINNKATYEIRLSKPDRQTGNPSGNPKSNLPDTLPEHIPGDITKQQTTNLKQIPPLSPPGEKTKEKFIPPTLEEVTAFCHAQQYSIVPGMFVAYYTSNGWMVGKNKMKDWKAALRTWQAKQNNHHGNTPNNRRAPNSGHSDFD